MATTYPSSIQTFTNPAGTSLLTSPDHGVLHTTVNDTLGSIQAVAGTTAGTSVLKNFAVGDFASRINSSNVLQQALQGTINNSVIGTPAITGGTINSFVAGTPTVTGGAFTNPAITGGTANGMVLGTPTIGTITVPGTVTALGFSAAIAPGVGTIVDSAGGTLTVNAQAAQIYYSAQGTAAGNRTIATPLNPVPYGLLTFAFRASGSANGTLVWGTVFRVSQDSGTPTLGTGTTWNYYGWRYNSIDSKYDFVGASKNLI